MDRWITLWFVKAKLLLTLSLFVVNTERHRLRWLWTLASHREFWWWNKFYSEIEDLVQIRLSRRRTPQVSECICWTTPSSLSQVLFGGKHSQIWKLRVVLQCSFPQRNNSNHHHRQSLDTQGHILWNLEQVHSVASTFLKTLLDTGEWKELSNVSDWKGVRVLPGSYRSTCIPNASPGAERLEVMNKLNVFVVYLIQFNYIGQ